MNLRAARPVVVPRPRDYLETPGGLYLAVVSSVVDDGHALTSLRYVRQGSALVKLGTDEANGYLREHRPAYLAHSTLVDAMVHRVPLGDVLRVHRPDERLAALRATTAGTGNWEREAGRGNREQGTGNREEGTGSGVQDRLEGMALRAVDALGQGGAPVKKIGLGGSLLLGAQHATSDIDLVVYGRAAFGAARRALAAAVASGHLQSLDQEQWEAAWSRRGPDLTLEEYVRAETRKQNKAVVGGTRVDLTLVVDREEEVPERGPFRKLGRIVMRAEVLDAATAFDHPARYRVRHDDVAEVVSFTPTYAGQAVNGETIEASGWVEVDSEGARRVVVGTSREAGGEWIRAVITSPDSSSSPRCSAP